MSKISQLKLGKEDRETSRETVTVNNNFVAKKKNQLIGGWLIVT